MNSNHYNYADKHLLIQDVLGMSDIFCPYLKPPPKQYKLNWEQHFFFPVSEHSHGILIPADTWQLSYSSKTADKPLDSNSKDTSSGNPCFPTHCPARFLLSSRSLKSIVQVLCLLRPWYIYLNCEQRDSLIPPIFVMVPWSQHRLPATRNSQTHFHHGLAHWSVLITGQ